jgi:hypothetical protein
MIGLRHQVMRARIVVIIALVLAIGFILTIVVARAAS